MTLEQYETLTSLRPGRAFLEVSVLRDRNPRTLIYGYDCDRKTVHIYFDGKTFKILRYFKVAEDLEEISTDILHQEHLPNKRSYAECCDYNVCLQILHAGLHLSFTVGSWDRQKSRFYGEISPSDGDLTEDSECGPMTVRSLAYTLLSLPNQNIPVVVRDGGTPIQGLEFSDPTGSFCDLDLRVPAAYCSLPPGKHEVLLLQGKMASAAAKAEMELLNG